MGRIKIDGWYAWVIVFGAFLSTSVMGALYSGVGVFFAVFREIFHSSRFVTAIFPAIFTASSMGSGMPIGILIGRFGERTVVLIGGVIISLCFLLSSYVNSISTIIFYQGILLGFGVSMVFMPGSIMVNKWHSMHREFAVGISTAGGCVGAMTIGTIVDQLVSAVGWRIMMRICALIFGAISLLAAVIFTPINININPSFDVLKVLSIKELCSIKAMKYLLVVCGLFSFMYTAVLTHIVDYALSAGIDSSTAYNLLVYWGAAGICGRILGGFCSSLDKERRLWAFFYWMVAMCSSVSIFPFLVKLELEGFTFPWFVIFLVVHGYASGAWFQLYVVVLADVFGIENLHNSLGVTLSAQVPVTILATPLAGLIADKTNNFWEYVFLGVCSMLCLPFELFFVKESLKLNREQNIDDGDNGEKEGSTNVLPQKTVNNSVTVSGKSAGAIEIGEIVKHDPEKNRHLKLAEAGETDKAENTLYMLEDGDNSLEGNEV